MNDEVTVRGAELSDVDAAAAARAEAEEREWRDRRAYARSSVLWPATLVYGGQSRDCVVHNLSANGAKIQTDDSDELPKNMTLRLPRFGDFAARLAWRRGVSAGLQFLDDPKMIADLLAPTLPLRRLDK
ncbi:PilZ domain-containing protein [Oceanibacterium hippocampi]|uniref:PilZ domain protein n=1 Tax=Oceanibacterium hippocampi TaxID=745714 RepID=A0A1Y5SFH5_9PROT|nr:PilZ domain-containing protein [Oceanibacterium hippocampi]SLN37914.1 PilZ domain protein [Oceanibacterium hippocampi]